MQREFLSTCSLQAGKISFLQIWTILSLSLPVCVWLVWIRVWQNHTKILSRVMLCRAVPCFRMWIEPYLYFILYLSSRTVTVHCGTGYSPYVSWPTNLANTCFSTYLGYLLFQIPNCWARETKKDFHRLALTTAFPPSLFAGWHFAALTQGFAVSHEVQVDVIAIRTAIARRVATPVLTSPLWYHFW